MSDTASKSSFLGSISPWSRSTTPQPNSPRHLPKEDGLQHSSGVDHAISLRPSPSLRRYPKDCPPLKTRWFYAVDVAKRKPYASDQSTEDKIKPLPAPKKYVAFSSSDSKTIEEAFQRLDKDDAPENEQAQTVTKVPVNEDYLYDVHIEKRELGPAYWLGPVYEVRRGSWFYSDGSILRPCDENLANQLEEGYLKIAPWKRLRLPGSRSSSQTRSRPRSMIADADTSNTPSSASTDATAVPDAQSQNTHRLFGTHMNTTVTYQDSTTAFLVADDFMSRMSGAVYGRFGTFGGTRVVRGWTEPSKPSEPKSADGQTNKEEHPSATVKTNNAPGDAHTVIVDSEHEHIQPKLLRPSALERQLSSLAGLRPNVNENALAEEDAREEEEKEMEDAREKDGEDQAREIDHLVLVTHGIGQRLGLRLDSINFVHDINVMRKTMKAVYATGPDLQALSGIPSNSKIQILPICWRHLLDFPKQSLKQNRKEYDLGEFDADFDDEYPSLQDITVDGVPAVRNLITDLAMDVLLYQSAYREHIASIVVKEANRVYNLFKQRTNFKGKVSLCGHSLGSAILFDVLCRQEETWANRPRRGTSKSSRDHALEQKELRLDFECENFFTLGSPIALFQMLKGRSIAGRDSIPDEPMVTSPFDSDPMSNNPFEAPRGSAPARELVPISTSSPKCKEFFNIFHPTDPIAYRIEPLISPAMAKLKPQQLPYVKKGLFDAPGLSAISARVGQSVMTSWYSLTSGVASTLINRSLGITGDEQALPLDKARNAMPPPPQPAATPLTGSATSPIKPVNPLNSRYETKRQADIAASASASDDPTIATPTLIDSEMVTLYAGFQKNRRVHDSAGADEPSGLEYQLEQERARKLKREEAKVRALNSNGRVDYSIQEGLFDVSLLASIASHLSYWADEDVNHFMCGQMLKARRPKDAEREKKL